VSGAFPEDVVAEAFDAHRERLVAVAYRMLGSRTDAEDAVQEAWLRLARQDADTIDNLAGWLTTVVGRICLDLLRSRRTHPETSYGERLPELVVTEDPDASPEEEAVLADSVGLALLVVLESLTPAERLAFVLHDTFAVPFDEIGRILGRSTDAAKMLASRARRKVRDAPPPTDEYQRARGVVDAFLRAAREGDFDGLLAVLDPEVTWHWRSPRGVLVRTGAEEIAKRAQHGARAAVTTRPVRVNGDPGFVTYGPDGRPVGVIACTVVDDRIVEIVSTTDPEELASLDLPERV
jgi:RNA polymerase sigma factor (sigma-70 family)